MVTNDFETFWLTATNIVLGLVTLVCCIVIGHSLLLEVKERLAARRTKLAVGADDHAFVIPMLGVTMADGGERVDKNATGEKDIEPKNGKPS